MSDTVYHERGNYVDEYASVDNGRLTRSGRMYRRSAISTNIPTNLPWCAVSTKRDGIIQLNNADSPRDIYSQLIPATTVRELLHEWKGDWIWDKLEIDDEDNLQWLNNALTTGTAILVSDGSYNRLWDDELAVAGWIIHCTASKKNVKGSFSFRGKTSNAYRAELIGIYDLHAFLLAMCKTFKIESFNAKLCCDNEKALELARDTGTRIDNKRKHADILRAIGSIKARMGSSLQYEHVKGHQDRRSYGNRLTTEA